MTQGYAKKKKRVPVTQNMHEGEKNEWYQCIENLAGYQSYILLVKW